MAKPFPEMIVLKKDTCPKCGASIGYPAFKVADTAVRAHCRTPECDYSVDVFWLGDAKIN